MAEKGQFIKLSRSIMIWEWYQNPNTSRLFIHCLMKANWCDGSFQGTVIPRGSFVSSYSKLGAELNLSVKEIRTSLSNLKKTGEVAHQAFNKFGLFTVNNYDRYQFIGSQEDMQKDTQEAVNGQSEGSQEGNNRRIYKDIKDFIDINKHAGAHENLIELFEEEFRRPLVAKECQMICDWQTDTDPLLIKYALKEAVLYQAYNIDYVSKVLSGWKSKGFTVNDIEEGKHLFKED